MNDQPFLKSVPQVVKFLRHRGYKVKKSKVYDDIKKGILRRQDNQSFRESDVLQYAAPLPRLMDVVDIEKQTAEKQKVEIQKIKEQTQSIVFDREVKAKKYVLRSEVEMLQSIKAGVFEAGLKHILQIKMHEFFMIVGGDPKKIQDAISFWMRAYDGLLNEFARLSEIEVSLDDGNSVTPSLFD